MTLEQMEQTYDKIDRLRVRGILQAECRCRTLKMGGVLWTPDLAFILNEIQFWTKVLKRRL